MDFLKDVFYPLETRKFVICGAFAVSFREGQEVFFSQNEFRDSKTSEVEAVVEILGDLLSNPTGRFHKALDISIWLDFIFVRLSVCVSCFFDVWLTCVYKYILKNPDP